MVLRFEAPIFFCESVLMSAWGLVRECLRTGFDMALRFHPVAMRDVALLGPIDPVLR
jgi:hypothetical protein